MSLGGGGIRLTKSHGEASSDVTGDHPFYKYAQYILQFDKLALGLLLVPYWGYVDICSSLPGKSSHDNI